MRIALLTGFLTLLGVFLGAWLTRRSDYEKWFRQAKAESIVVLVEQMRITRQVARDAYYDDATSSELSNGIKATEAFENLSRFSGVVRLYLSTEGRLSLVALEKKLRLQCTTEGGPANCRTDIEATMEQVQQLLEQELEIIPKRLKFFS